MATWLQAEREYQVALDVALQWFHTWHVTKSQRHLETALTCAAIARERFPIHRTDRRVRRVYSHLIAAQHRIEAAHTATDIQSGLVECRALLDVIAEGLVAE
jgi:hypothetical protein